MVNQDKTRNISSVDEAQRSQEKRTFVAKDIDAAVTRMCIARLPHEYKPVVEKIAYLGCTEVGQYASNKFLSAIRPSFELYRRGFFLWFEDATDYELQDYLYHKFTGNKKHIVTESLLPSVFYSSGHTVPQLENEIHHYTNDKGRSIEVIVPTLVQPLGIHSPLELAYTQDRLSKIPQGRFKGDHHPIIVTLRLKEPVVTV